MARAVIHLALIKDHARGVAERVRFRGEVAADGCSLGPGEVRRVVVRRHAVVARRAADARTDRPVGEALVPALLAGLFGPAVVEQVAPGPRIYACQYTDSAVVVAADVLRNSRRQLEEAGVADE